MCVYVNVNRELSLIELGISPPIFNDLWRLLDRT